MRRLLERGDLDGAERALADLLEAEPQFREDPFRKRRIFVRLSRPSFTRRRWFALRPLLAGMLLSGAAVGAIGSAWLAPHRTHTIAPRPAPPASSVAVPHAPARAAVPSGSVPPAATTESKPEGRAAPVTTSVPLREAALPRPIARSSTAYPPGEDPSSVVRAIVALRNEKDPQRASALLGQYLEKHPSGALSEDALALSIEAAARDHDPRGAALARRYLERYPEGRYRAFAQKALRELGQSAR